MKMVTVFSSGTCTDQAAATTYICYYHFDQCSFSRWKYYSGNSFRDRVEKGSFRRIGSDEKECEIGMIMMRWEAHSCSYFLRSCSFLFVGRLTRSVILSFQCVHITWQKIGDVRAFWTLECHVMTFLHVPREKVSIKNIYIAVSNKEKYIIYFMIIIKNASDKLKFMIINYIIYMHACRMTISFALLSPIKIMIIGWNGTYKKNDSI